MWKEILQKCNCAYRDPMPQKQYFSTLSSRLKSKVSITSTHRLIPTLELTLSGTVANHRHVATNGGVVAVDWRSKREKYCIVHIFSKSVFQKSNGQSHRTGLSAGVSSQKKKSERQMRQATRAASILLMHLRAAVCKNDARCIRNITPLQHKHSQSNTYIIYNINA